MQGKYSEISEVTTKMVPDTKESDPVRMVPDIGYALRHGCFIPFFQPLHDATTGHCVGAEILARLPLPDGTVCLPDKIIPQLDTIRDLPVLTQMLLEKVGDALSCVSLPLGFMLAFNITADMAGEAWLTGYCLRLQKRLQDKVTLVVEITEQSPLSRYDRNWQSQLASLKAAGVLVALDDFGTGFSSLHLLQQTRADILKLPREFTQLCTPGYEGIENVLTDTVLYLATRLNVVLIAEGIETLEQRDMFVRKGFTLMQGWHFSPPLSVQDFYVYLRTHCEM